MDFFAATLRSGIKMVTSITTSNVQLRNASPMVVFAAIKIRKIVLPPATSRLMLSSALVVMLLMLHLEIPRNQAQITARFLRPLLVKANIPLLFLIELRLLMKSGMFCSHLCSFLLRLFMVELTLRVGVLKAIDQ
jgi:hypothetical protein